LTEKKRAAVLCAGGAVQDIVMRVEAFPKAGHKVQASDYVVTIGGQSGNAAVAVARSSRHWRRKASIAAARCGCQARSRRCR
jgi:sugar/nucleoside kinase (ribokinase family)